MICRQPRDLSENGPSARTRTRPPYIQPSHCRLLPPTGPHPEEPHGQCTPICPDGSASMQLDLSTFELVPPRTRRVGSPADLALSVRAVPEVRDRCFAPTVAPATRTRRRAASSVVSSCSRRGQERRSSRARCCSANRPLPPSPRQERRRPVNQIG